MMAQLMRESAKEMSDPMRVQVLAMMLGFAETSDDKTKPRRLEVAKLPVTKKDRMEAEEMVRRFILYSTASAEAEADLHLYRSKTSSLPSP